MRRFTLLLAALLLGSPALADTLLDNASGLTVDRSGRLQRFTGLVIGNDGKVAALLRAGDPRPRKIDYRLDLQRRFLLPGLIDAHGHVMTLGLGALQLDLTGTNSIPEVQQRLSAYAARNTTPRWIVGRGWNQENWPGKALPTAADLDAVVRDRPVWLVRVDGHAAVGNSLALSEAGITTRTPAPSGGRIEKSGGVPTGLFVDNARALVEKIIPPPLPLQSERALVKAQEMLLSNGLTAVTDMGTSVDEWLVMRRFADAGRLQIRILSFASGVEAMASIAGSRPTSWLYSDRLRLAGVKLYADGALGSRGALLKAPYADDPTRGLQLLDDVRLRNLASRAAMDGFQVAVHAIGDAANAQVIAAFEELALTYTGDRRWRIEHVQVLDPADLPRIARGGIIASMQPTHQTSDRLMAEARLGPARLAGAYAWNSIALSGAHLAFGSDFPVESPNPFPGIAAAVSRQDPAGQPPVGWRSEERVTLDQALAGFTREAAFAAFAEDRLGSLDPGRWADFILVDRDISAALPQDIAATQVLETWVGGRKVWQRAAIAPASAPPAR